MMGPVEQELREQVPFIGHSGTITWVPPLGMRAYGFVGEAARRLDCEAHRDLVRHLPDVLSDAIEAAEALKR